MNKSFFVWLAVMDGLYAMLTHESAPDAEAQTVEDAVAVQYVQRYMIAYRAGDTAQTCAHAGLAAAAYLQAKNEEAYRKWSKTRDDDCRRIGG